MSISGTLRRHGRIFLIGGNNSVGGFAPGTDCCRPHPLLHGAQLAVETRLLASVPGDRPPLRLLRRHADHGQDFSQTGEHTVQAVVSQENREILFIRRKLTADR